MISHHAKFIPPNKCLIQFIFISPAPISTASMFISLLISFKIIRIYFRRFLRTKFKQNIFWRCICTELIDIHLRLGFESVDLRKTINKCLQPGQILPSDYFLVAAFILSALFRPGLITRITDETFFMKRKQNRKERK